MGKAFYIHHEMNKILVYFYRSCALTKAASKCVDNCRNTYIHRRFLQFRL